MKSLIFIRFTLLFAILILPQKSFADGITPSHVFQKTEILRLLLIQRNLLDIQTYDSIENSDALRHPRHVMQKVRECYTIVQKLLNEHNIAASPLPSLTSAIEIKPSDVQNSVKHLIAEVEKIPAKTKNRIKAPSVSGKLPNDVYNNLKKICASTAASITPEDIYRVVSVVNNNVKKIARLRGYTIAPTDYDFRRQDLSDVYTMTLNFLDELRILALNPDFAIPGGVIIPNHMPTDSVKPHDIMAVMNDALSGTAAMMYALNIHETIALPELQERKELADIYSELYEAQNIVKLIIEKESEE